MVLPLFKYKYYNFYIILYGLLLLAVILFKIIHTGNTDYYIAEDFNYLSGWHTLAIFLLNLLAILLGYGMSYMGLGIPFVIMILARFCLSIIKNFSYIWAYGVAILPHGIIELMILYYIFEISIDNMAIYRKMYKGDLESYPFDYEKVLKQATVIFILLFVAAFVEVYISNRFFMYLIANFY